MTQTSIPNLRTAKRSMTAGTLAARYGLAAVSSGPNVAVPGLNGQPTSRQGTAWSTAMCLTESPSTSVSVQGAPSTEPRLTRQRSRRVDGQTDKVPIVYDEREPIDFAWRWPNSHLFATAMVDIPLLGW